MLIRVIIYTGGEELTYGELKKMLKKGGCYFDHNGKRHEIWINPKTGVQFPVGRYNSQEVKTGTLKSILEDAGLK